MKKSGSKTLIYLMIISLLFLAVSPALAARPSRPPGTPPGTPSETLVVHKILMNDQDLENHPAEGKEYNPLTGIEDITILGPSAKEIAGVYFVALNTTTDVAKIEQAENGDFTFVESLPAEQKGLTEANGLTLKMNPGTWKVYEVKSMSTYQGPNKELLEKQKAVPVEVTLPLRGSSGETGPVHIYPKNTENKPQVDKFVGSLPEEGNNGKEASYDIGESHTWYITSTLPADIKDYHTFKLTDVLANELSYIGNVSVKVGETALTANTHYVMSEPTVEAGGNLTIDFSGKTAALADYAGKKVIISFEAKINDNAVMGKVIPNDVTLNYGHKDESSLTTTPIEKPQVYTGGKIFIKKDQDKTDLVLSGAEFVVKNENGEYLVETEGGREWLASEGDEVPSNALKITSGEDGIFSITGLKAGNYFAKEIKAPAGYILRPDTEVAFTVDKTSYYTDPENSTGEMAPMALPQDVFNTKMTIPHTGGIGTIAFTVAGLLLMAIAIISLRRRKETE